MALTTAVSTWLVDSETCISGLAVAIGFMTVDCVQYNCLAYHTPVHHWLHPAITQLDVNQCVTTVAAVNYIIIKLKLAASLVQSFRSSLRPAQSRTGNWTNLNSIDYHCCAVRLTSCVHGGVVVRTLDLARSRLR